MPGNDEEILRLEKARIEATLAKDTDALDKLFDDELVYMRTSGRVDTKASYIQSMERGNAHYKALTISNVKVRRYDECAIVSGDLVMLTKVSQELRFTSVWYKRGDQWRNVHWCTVRCVEQGG